MIGKCKTEFLLFWVLSLCFMSATHTLFAQEIEGEKGIFGSVEFPSTSLRALPKWKNVLKRIMKEEKRYHRCEKKSFSCENDGMLSWRQFVQEQKQHVVNKKETLQRVNRFLNQWIYTPDLENWKTSDYWATPLEFVSSSGDCEDYAIIKYVTLKELGFSVDQLRLVVVKDTLRNIPHAVLAVYLEKEEDIFILDSLFNTVLSHKDVMQYTPYYSVNEKKRWTHFMP